VLAIAGGITVLLMWVLLRSAGSDFDHDELELVGIVVTGAWAAGLVAAGWVRHRRR
jgi:uncharacterized protein (TIGR03382 family)